LDDAKGNHAGAIGVDVAIALAAGARAMVAGWQHHIAPDLD